MNKGYGGAPCAIPECGRRARSRGWCEKHYLRWRRKGDPLAVKPPHRTHGESSGSSEYNIWRSMKSRCGYKNNSRYSYYGGRGITVCERWAKSFQAFIEDMGRRPSPTHSLNRINNDGNYEPGNVEWATMVEQARNKSRNTMLTIQGESHCITAWAEISGVNAWVIRARLRRGMSAREAVFTPPSRRGLLTIDGTTKSIGEWAKDSPVGKRTIKQRLDHGWGVRDAVFRPPTPTSERRWRQSERDELEAA